MLDVVDRIARDQETTRGGMIAGLPQREEQALARALMEEAYREMAVENRGIAEEAFPAASEMLRRQTEWKERPRG